MTVQKTIQIGNPKLRQVCEDVSFPLSEQDIQLGYDLVDTMDSAGLVGEAAVQIGVMKRVFVMGLEKEKKDESDENEFELCICYNPTITQFSDKKEFGREGCGSIAYGKLFGQVERPKSIELEYYDRTGQKHVKKFDGLFARIAQHEIDHLDGILFLDRMDDPTQLYDIDELPRKTDDHTE